MDSLVDVHGNALTDEMKYSCLDYNARVVDLNNQHAEGRRPGSAKREDEEVQAKSRSWTHAEDALVRDLVKQHGPKKWAVIAERLSGKTQKQVSRAVGETTSNPDSPRAPGNPSRRSISSKFKRSSAISGPFSRVSCPVDLQTRSRTNSTPPVANSSARVTIWHFKDWLNEQTPSTDQYHRFPDSVRVNPM